jgi:hypothetical protein
MPETLRFGQIELTPLRFLGVLYELFLCLLPVINVDTRTIPPNQVSSTVEYRNPEVQHPPIDTIGSSHSRCVFKGLPLSKGLTHRLHEGVDVVGMNTTGPTPAQQTFQRHTGEVEPRLIKEIEVAIWPCCMEKHRRQVDNLTEK